MTQKCQYFLNPADRPKTRLPGKYNTLFKSQDPLAFHQSLRKYEPTDFKNLSKLARSLAVTELWIKDESKRFRLNTFKSLGASFAIHKFLENNKKDVTFCTATDGNHGRSVAWAARKFKQKAVIYVPKHTATARIRNIRRHKSKVVVVEGDYDETVVRAREDASEHGYVLIQDTSWKDYTLIPTLISAGYTTMLEEIDQNTVHPGTTDFDFVFLQAGVGTWASSVITWYRNKHPRKMPRFVLVEPLESDSFLESMKNNRISATKKSQETIMAGLNCGTPSLLAWDILKNGIDLFLSIPDAYAVKAMQDLYYPFKNDPQIFAGESGAAGLAGLIALSCDPALKKVKNQVGLKPESKVLIFNTEGVTDPDSFDETIAREVDLF